MTLNRYRCETCKFKDATNEELRKFHLRECTKCNFIIEPIAYDQMELHGCASHSDFQSNLDKVIVPLNTVYEKFDHLDKCLSDTEWCEAGNTSAIYGIAGELWRAIKESLRQTEVE